MTLACDACGCRWWVEQTLIRPAAAPAADPRFPTAAAERRYRLVCGACGTPAVSDTDVSPAAAQPPEAPAAARPGPATKKKQPAARPAARKRT